MSMTTPIFLAPAAAVAELTAHPVVQPLPDTDPASEIQEERIEPQAEESRSHLALLFVNTGWDRLVSKTNFV